MDQVATIPMDAEKLLDRIDYLEENRRFIQNALEMALSLGDFQENINKGYGAEYILQEADKRISHLIPFEANALYLVDQENSNFDLSVCNQKNLESFIQSQVDHMIEQGYFAWAIREKRGVLISSKDHSRKFVLHVIATYSRIRGMYVGLLPEKDSKIPDTSLTLLSIILLNTANALESLEFYSLLRNQNEVLEQMVEERTQTLAKYERQLQQVLKIQAIGTLAGGIAHDFNNILFPIVGYTELTMDEVPEDSVAHNNLEEILKAANRAKELVKQILTFSRQGSQERKPVEVQQVAKEALKLLRASIPASIEIVHDIHEDCAPVMGDATQIHQVIMNLCTNAYQAMQDKGGKLEVSLKEIYVDYAHTVQKIGMQPGRHVQLQVKDEGCGMDAAVLDRIFEPYYTTKEQGKGTGLGLSVIHGIIKNHRGDITATSSPGKGAVFTVLLPVIEEEDVQTEYEPVKGTERGSERILLVDDEEQIVSMERQMLENLGYKVTARTDSIEALNEFSKQPQNYDLVITDMTMPRMSGDELARKLLDVKPDIPVILCTGFNEDITEEKALEMGIQKFIMKPVIKNDLATTIRSVLDPYPPN
ncbi:MAG: response regulator [Deltaproteobacteria bacterium]|jgi:signal transduction histidine kinase|nr:response regulator [Deltaproteobacteria bacterium]